MSSTTSSRPRPARRSRRSAPGARSASAASKPRGAARRGRNAASCRRYRQTHHEHRLTYEARYRSSHRERILAYQRDRYADTKAPTPLALRVSHLMLHPERYVFQTTGVKLRPYQAEPIDRILHSIRHHLGDSFVLVFPRQSGKDEFLIHLKIFLADLYSVIPVSIVEINPTYRPQTAAAVQRFDKALQANVLTRGQWTSKGAFTRQLGEMQVRFLSGDKSASVAGATASLLLIVNEAQDIAPEVYRRTFEPMAASTNATRIFAGTAWTSRTLLAQEKQAGLQAERQDGRKRVYTVDAAEVGQYAPWYGAHVEAAIQRHGRQHPMVRTQYFNEEIDAQGGMFHAARRALMLEGAGEPGQSLAGPVGMQRAACAFTVDVAGQDERTDGAAARLSDGFGNPGRDSTTLSIYEIDVSTLEIMQAPTFRVVRRQQWMGLNHLTVFGQLKALAEQWRPLHIVVDATGVGEGLWAMLDKAFPTRVVPVRFSAQKKSEMGYRFLSLIETGRFRDACSTAEADEQYAACISEVLLGPQKTMRWGVPDGRRNANGELLHDDIIMADALITEVDSIPGGWMIASPALIVQPKDPLDDMSHFR